MKRQLMPVIAGVAFLYSQPASAAMQDGLASDLAILLDQLTRERAALEAQQQALDAQRARLQSLEDDLLARMRGTGIRLSEKPSVKIPGESAAAVAVQDSTAVPLPPSPPPAPQGAAVPGTDVQPVGQAPTEQRTVEVAALAEQGGIITRAGRLTLESDLEYARSDRNRAIFRGVSIPEAVLIGVFDINESRQDVLTAAGVARLGLTNRFEINARVPYVYRSDKTVLAPVADPSQPYAGQLDRPVSDGNLGDIDFGMRYQITDGTSGFPYLIAGVQAVAPTGTNPFKVRRDSIGNALEAASGSGFWGVTPNITAILPSDPAVLFGTLGYTVNFARDIDRQIGAAFINEVNPGDQISATLGIAISLNTRTSISLGYAHSWVLGTRTQLRMLDQNNELGAPVETETRDLQLGRLLFGVSYRTNPRTTINWNVEVGATEDATDLRTTLRIPFTLDAF